jgi:hypothetical protein
MGRDLRYTNSMIHTKNLGNLEKINWHKKLATIQVSGRDLTLPRLLLLYLPTISYARLFPKVYNR